MVRASLSELLEALGAVLIVAGLAFWSLPVSLVAAGVFLVVVANAPGGRLPAAPPGQDGRRAEPGPPPGRWRPNPAVRERERQS